MQLAADTDGAEAENDVAAAGGPAETHHGTEAGKDEHLVELVTKIGAARARENLIVNHLALGVDGDVNEKTMRQRKFDFVLFGRPRLRIVGQRDELRGPQEIELNVVGDGANGDSGHGQLQNDYE